MTFFVLRPGRRGEVTAVDGRATCGVGHDHAIAEELADEFDVGSFAATCASAREFEERLNELRALDRCFVDFGARFVWKCIEEFEIFAFFLEVIESVFHFESALSSGGALRDADAAAGAVVGIDLDAHFGSSGNFFAFPIARGEAGGCIGRGFGQEGLDADGGVRARNRAEGATDTSVWIPNGDFASDTAFFPFRRSGGEMPIGIEDGGWERFAFVFHEFAHDLLDVFGSVAEIGADAVQIAERRWDFDFVEVFTSGIDGGVVLLNDGFALLAVCFFGSFFDFFDGLGFGQDAGEFEEACLHDGIDARAHARRFGDFTSVDDEESDFLFDDFFLRFGGNVIPRFFGGVWAVQEECSAHVGIGEYFAFFDEPELVNGDEVCALDEVCPFDGLFAESEVRNRLATRFFRVVDEVTLREHRGIFADDFDGVFVGADGAVATQTEEDGARVFGVFGDEGRIPGDAVFGEVVGDPDGEVIFGSVFFEFIQDGFCHCRREFFRREAIATADDFWHIRADDFAPAFGHGSDDIQIERFAQRASFFRAIQDGDRFDRFGERRQDGFCVERTIQMDGEDTRFFAFCIESIDGFVSGTDSRPHENHDAIGIGGTVVFEDVILTTREFCESIHRFFDDTGDGVVVGIARFASLEEDIGVLRRAADGRVFGRESAIMASNDEVFVDECTRIFERQIVDFVDFVRRAEAVEEVEERNARFERRHLGDHRHVLGFLNARRRKHGESGRAGVHDVAVIAKDRKSMACQATRGDVENRRREFASDFEHVRNLEQETLRRGERRRQGAALKRAVNGTCGTRFALHFDDAGNFVPNVFLRLRRPIVGELCHRRGRRNRVNTNDFVRHKRGVCRCFVTINCLDKRHVVPSP